MSWLILAFVSAAQAAGVPAPANCGFEQAIARPPKRAVTMNQAATEIVLALGLQDRMAATAYLDDEILPELAAAYHAIPVLAARYPSREALLAIRPDFVYASYATAFMGNAAGTREELAALGIATYLSPSACPPGSRPGAVKLETTWEEVRDIGRIFGVPERADALIRRYEADLQDVVRRIGAPPATRVFWYDDGDPPSAGTCCGAPAMLMTLLGVQNIFGDVPGSWARVSWESVIERNPAVIVLADAAWSRASEKRRFLEKPAFATIDAIRDQRFVTLAFSSTTPGIRNVAAVRRLAEQIYPERFTSGKVPP